MRFRVRPARTLGPGDVIRNRTTVQLDVDPSMLTDTAETRIQAGLGLAVGAKSLPGEAWPNPTYRLVNVAVRLAQGGLLTLRLLDATGRMVRQEERTAPVGAWQGQLTAGSLPARLYLLDVRTGAQRLSRRLVVRP